MAGVRAADDASGRLPRTAPRRRAHRGPQQAHRRARLGRIAIPDPVRGVPPGPDPEEPDRRPPRGVPTHGRSDPLNRPGADVPDRLALLPSAAASKYLTNAVRSGHERLPQVAILRAAAPIEDGSSRWSTAPVREIVEEAMLRFAETRTEADAWLAPRLHATLRMT